MSLPQRSESLQPDKVLIQPIKLDVSVLASFPGLTSHVAAEVTECQGVYSQPYRHCGLNIYPRACAKLLVPRVSAFNTPGPFCFCFCNFTARRKQHATS
jgi:hypothetical protein